MITAHNFSYRLSRKRRRLFNAKNPRGQKKKNSTQLISHDDGSETASDADRPAGRSLRKTPSSE